jgi:hypothetical protein
MAYLDVSRQPLFRIPACVFLAIVLFVAACKKDNSVSVALSGTYSGKFVRLQNGVFTYQGAGSTASINFNNGNFSATAYISYPNANGIPITSNGSYSTSADSVTFNAAIALNTNPLQLSPLVANGTYEYHFEGDSLIITRNYQPNSYNQYRLKQN